MRRGRSAHLDGEPARQFALERDLAARLLSASREERRQLYGSVYDQLFSAYPHLTGSRDPSEAGIRLRAQLATVQPYVRAGSDIAEVGSGGGELARALADLGAKVTALDVAYEPAGDSASSGVSRVTFDGLELPLRSKSQDVIVSFQTLEHLHPEDAVLMVREAHRCLRPGGVLVLSTPNRLLGPHDVSRGFARNPQGLHLHEYTLCELDGGLGRLGFEAIDVLVGWRTAYLRIRGRRVLAAERAASLIPFSLRQTPAARRLLTGVLGIRLAAHKAR